MNESNSKDPTISLINYLIDTPEELDASDNLTKYIIAKCLLHDINQESSLRSFLNDLKTQPAYKHFFQQREEVLQRLEKSVFKYKNDEYVQFIVKTEEMDCSILKDRFNDIKAKDDMFYVQRQENDIFSEYFSKGRHILVRGPAKTGKTRLVFEELRKLDNHLVFSLRQRAFDHIDELIISDNFNQEKRKLIWFIDDIHYYLGIEDTLWKMYEKLISKLPTITVIATLRADKDIMDKTRLAQNMKRVNIEQWSQEEGNQLADHYGVPRYKFTGTPFSIIGDIDEMKVIYDEKVCRTRCRFVLFYLKLLNEFMRPVECSLLEETSKYLNKDLFKVDTFDQCLFRLEREGFLYIKEGYAISWEPYLMEIITEKHYWHLESDLRKLNHLFVSTKRISELSYLGWHLHYKKDFAKSIECQRQVVELSSEDNKPLWKPYHTWGKVLYAWAQENRDLTLYEQACEKFQKAIDLKNDFAEAYDDLGMAKANIAFISEDDSKFADAIDKFKKAVKCQPEYAKAYFDWGIILAALGKMNGDAELFKEACHKFHLAKKHNGDLPAIYYNLGETLYDYSTICDDKQISEKIIALLLRSYLLCVIDQRFDLFGKVHKKLEKVAKEFNDEVCPIILNVYNNAIFYIYFGDIKNTDEILKERLREYKGKIKITDIIIDAIIDGKAPDNIPDDNLMTRAAVLLANEAIKIIKVREKYAKYFGT